RSPRNVTPCCSTTASGTASPCPSSTRPRTSCDTSSIGGRGLRTAASAGPFAGSTFFTYAAEEPSPPTGNVNNNSALNPVDCVPPLSIGDGVFAAIDPARRTVHAVSLFDAGLVHQDSRMLHRFPAGVRHFACDVGALSAHYDAGCKCAKPRYENRNTNPHI